MQTRTQIEVFLAAIQECRDIFANTYHEECTPYAKLSWGLSRVIGTEPKDHVPASRWHNALCCVSEKDVEDYDTWAKAAFDLHLSQMINKTTKTHLEACCYHVLLPDLDRETVTFIDREIKRVYPTVRRNTKRYKELVTSVKIKAKILTANSLIARMKNQRDRLVRSMESDKREADKVRLIARELERASEWALKLCPDRADELCTATRNMLDARLTHADRVEKRLAGDLEMIDDFITSMVEIEKG